MLAALLFASANVVAPPVEVTTRGAACEGAQLGARIEHYLRASSQPADIATTVDAELRREGALWRLDLRVPSDGELRTFRAASCATVIDAAAFVVAVAIDPAVADAIDGPDLAEPEGVPDAPPAETDAPPPTPAQPLDPAAAVEPVAPNRDDADAGTLPPVARDRVAAPREPRPASIPAITLGAGVGIDGGSLPRVGALVRLDVGILGRRWRVDVRGQFRTPSRATADIDRDIGGSISAWSIGARGCGLPVLRPRGLDLPLCAGVEAGQVRAQGFGFDGARSSRLPWAAVTVGPALTWAVRPALALIVTAEIGASLLGGAFAIEGLQTVHRIGPVFGRGLVGLEGRFRGRSRS